MGFLPVRTLLSEKWGEAVILLLMLAFFTSCAASDLKPDDNKSLAQQKLKEALQAGSLNQQEKMVALLKEAQELNPKEPNYYFFLGEAYFTQGDLKQAEQEFLKSIQLFKDLKDSYRQLGLIYMQQGQWEKSIQYFREYLDRPGTLQPQQIYNWVALCFYNLGKKNEAEIEWKKALEIKDNAGIRLNLALAYINQERFDRAKTSLLKALSLKPRFSQAHYELAQLYLKEKNKDQALDHFQKVILYSPRGSLAKKSKEYIELVRPE
ncbi:MAG: tetratricopeptide repeat protein [Nitrospinae bacterium]|nr:tetratricopeptide repeat protein [Nitrospinota bacterium]MZH40519.1 tetratricopeptide repeat protein [Nitrospinota bacterium]